MRKKLFSVKHFLRRRNTIQMIATFFTNVHIPNFFKGEIFTGKTKGVCVPGLNCYSCPAAAGACPVGSFQAVVGSEKFRFSYYITGVLILFGVVLGRFVCGFLCPFGWVQDLLHKIPLKKIPTKKLKALTYVKYIILLIFVCILPNLIVNKAGMGSPYFCKYICPQGILEGGIPLSIVNSSIRESLGILFTAKSVILAITAMLGIVFYRPFCKWACPLGAFYSLFNKVSFMQYSVDEKTCISCGKCKKVCKMDVDITQDAKAFECIRCGECIKNCPTKAIKVSYH